MLRQDRHPSPLDLHRPVAHCLPRPPLPAAPSSAHAVRSFKPYCIFQGDESAPIHAWLREHNVTIIRHVPKWRDELVVRAKTKAKVCPRGGCARVPVSGRATCQDLPRVVLPVTLLGRAGGTRWLCGPGGKVEEQQVCVRWCYVVPRLAGGVPDHVLNPHSLAPNPAAPAGQRGAQPPVQDARHAGVHLPARGPARGARAGPVHLRAVH